MTVSKSTERRLKVQKGVVGNRVGGFGANPKNGLSQQKAEAAARPKKEWTVLVVLHNDQLSNFYVKVSAYSATAACGYSHYIGGKHFVAIDTIDGLMLIDPASVRSLRATLVPEKTEAPVKAVAKAAPKKKAKTKLVGKVLGKTW